MLYSGGSNTVQCNFDFGPIFQNFDNFESPITFFQETIVNIKPLSLRDDVSKNYSYLPDTRGGSI